MSMRRWGCFISNCKCVKVWIVMIRKFQFIGLCISMYTVSTKYILPFRFLKSPKDKIDICMYFFDVFRYVLLAAFFCILYSLIIALLNIIVLYGDGNDNVDWLLDKWMIVIWRLWNDCERKCWLDCDVMVWWWVSEMRWKCGWWE